MLYHTLYGWLWLSALPAGILTVVASPLERPGQGGLHALGGCVRRNLELLARRPEHDLVHVHIFGLADGENDCSRE